MTELTWDYDEEILCHTATTADGSNYDIFRTWGTPHYAVMYREKEQLGHFVTLEEAKAVAEEHYRSHP
jgi:hypothetical protein